MYVRNMIPLSIQTADPTTNAIDNTADGTLELPRPWPSENISAR